MVVYLAICYVEGGQPEAAIAALDEAEAVVGKESAVHSAGMLRARGLALADLGRLDEARATIEKGLAAAEDQGLPYEVALLLLAKDRLEHPGSVERGPDSDRGLEILNGLGVDLHPEPVVSV